MKFTSYALSNELKNALTERGYFETTPVQEKTIVNALRGKSMIVKAETGSGKTHAFLIPAIEKLDMNLNKIQVLIVEPTQELCHQCGKFLQDLCSSMDNPFRVIINSNVSREDSTISVDKPSVLIATPGKLKDLLFVKKTLEINPINLIILDEADMLLEGNDSQDIINVVDKINPKQKLIYTATMKEHQIASLKKLFKINDMVNVDKNNFSSKNVSHHFVDIKHRPLEEALMLFIRTVNPYFTLVFASKKTLITSIYRKLCDEGVRCALLNSDMSLNERKNVLRRIQDGEYELVLCSDLASRGLDLEKVTHVISLDIPSNIDYYYHRAGRTGRYKDKGDSYIFFDNELNKKSKELLEKKLKFDYLILRAEGLKQDKRKKPQQKKKNEKLEAEIKKELAKVRSNKVKPNYKKKMRRAVEKATKRHKRQIVIQNLKSKRKAMNAIED